MKYVLVTGGVVSGLGKGVTASSIGVLLKNCGLRVTSIKIGVAWCLGNMMKVFMQSAGSSNDSWYPRRPLPQHRCWHYVAL
jgi:hypothetical protein